MHVGDEEDRLGVQVNEGLEDRDVHAFVRGKQRHFDVRNLKKNEGTTIRAYTHSPAAAATRRLPPCLRNLQQKTRYGLCCRNGEKPQLVGRSVPFVFTQRSAADLRKSGRDKAMCQHIRSRRKPGLEAKHVWVLSKKQKHNSEAVSAWASELKHLDSPLQFRTRPLTSALHLQNPASGS